MSEQLKRIEVNNVFMSDFSFEEFCDNVAERISDDYRTYRECCKHDTSLEKMDSDDIVPWLIDDFAREVSFCLEGDLNDIWEEDIWDDETEEEDEDRNDENDEEV